MVWVFENTKLVTISSVAVVSGLVVGALSYRKYLKNRPPTKWMQVGEVEELCIYPVKSFRGVSLDFFECSPSGARVGLMRDRSFVVIDEEGKFVTGRDYPKMTQIDSDVEGTTITFSYDGGLDKVEVDMKKIGGDRKKVRIWDTWTEGSDCGDEVATWLSRRILDKESGLRLLFCGLEDKGKKANGRVTELSRMEDVQLENTDGGFFSDGVSYHLISMASIKELNSRVDGPKVSALNFRPNIIIKGEMLVPFEEDEWRWVKIGKVVFRCLAPCTRCLFTTVDPATGEKSDKMEPLASLRRFRYVRDSKKRKLLDSPAMGIYLGVRSEGDVSVGDQVFIPQI